MSRQGTQRAWAWCVAQRLVRGMQLCFEEASQQWSWRWTQWSSAGPSVGNWETWGKSEDLTQQALVTQEDASDNNLPGMIPCDILPCYCHGRTLPRQGQLVGRVADPEAPGILVKLSWWAQSEDPTVLSCTDSFKGFPTLPDQVCGAIFDIQLWLRFTKTI